jgi:hypothetical protein
MKVGWNVKRKMKNEINREGKEENYENFLIR